MSLTSHTLERIELYTKGKLSPEDELAFEHEMALDANLQKQVELSLVIDQMIIGEEAAKLKVQMQKDLKAPQKARLYATVGVVILIFLGLAFYLLSPSKNGTSPLPTASQLPHSHKQQPVKENPPTPEHSQASVENGGQVHVQKKTIDKSPVLIQALPPSSMQEQQTEPLNVAKETQTQPEVKHVMVQTNVEPLVKAPCESLKSEVEFLAVPSCAGEESGEVHVKIETVKGGTPPYQFHLSGKVSSGSFVGIGAGSYSLTILDASRCSVEASNKVVVPERRCRQDAHYVFHPDYDPAWTIPYDKVKKPHAFKMMDKGGKIYYQSPVVDFHPSEWSGESNTGATLGIGLYFYTIEYTDGSVDEGSITVSR